MAKPSYSEDEQALLKAFGELVRRHRLQFKWSQEDLAEHTGLHRTYIGSVERGERNVSLINIALLATTLQVPMIQLLPDLESFCLDHQTEKSPPPTS